MFVSQIRDLEGDLAVVVREGSEAYKVASTNSVLELADAAIRKGVSMTTIVADRGMGDVVDLGVIRSEGRVMLPITHPDPAHLTIFGAAYASNGQLAVAPGQSTPALGDRDATAITVAIVGIYVIGPSGAPFRVGFSLGHEFAATPGNGERAHGDSQKKHCASFGPEILVGAPPRAFVGTSRTGRGDRILREHFHRPDPSAFLADIARLERLRFSGAPSGAPGDIHVHFFADKGCAGADTLSLDPGDSIETAIPDFGLPLRNAVSKALPHQGYVNVEVL